MDMRDIERRALAIGIEVETRDDGKKKLRGHAAVFNALSEDLGGFREQITPGAFTDALTTDDVRLLINHDGLPLARNLSGTLKLTEDARGLAIEADLDEDDPDVQRLLPKLLRGDVNQMSFGFSVRPGGQDWAKNDEGQTIRTLKKLRLFDVSVVTYPAYTQTDVAVRELRTWEQSLKAPTPYRLMRALERQASI
jgi:HK97 family phage prohead protease